MTSFRYRPSAERFERHMGDKVFFYAHDANGRFLYLSDSVIQVLGYTP